MERNISELSAKLIAKHGSIRKAAKVLGVSHGTLYAWMKYGSGSKNISTSTGIRQLLEAANK